MTKILKNTKINPNTKLILKTENLNIYTDLTQILDSKIYKETKNISKSFNKYIYIYTVFESVLKKIKKHTNIKNNLLMNLIK